MQQQSILLVDDDTEFLDVLRRRFERRGFRVLTCDAPGGVLEAAHCAGLDVAILDLTLNGLSSLDLVRGLKKLYPALPIIMLSGHSSRESIDSARKAGAQRYLCKPCSLAEIEAAVIEVVAPPAAAANGDSGSAKGATDAATNAAEER